MPKILRILTFLCLASLFVRAEEPKPFRFVAISDTHIAAPEDLAKFRAFLHTIKKKINPDFVLMLGDDCGHAPEYLPLIREIILHSGVDVHLVAGNHDDNYAKNPEWFQSVFGRMYYSFDHNGWHFIMNWSQSLPLEWLGKDIAGVNGKAPVVLCQHYAPNRPPLSEEEVIKQEPWATVLKHPGPKLFLSGHLHRRSIQKLSGVDSITLEQWFFNGEKDPGEYAVMDALADGTVKAEYLPMTELKLEEPEDKVPECAIAEPLDGIVLSGLTTFKGAASDDDGIKWVSYQVDDGPWLPATGAAEWTFQLDPAVLAAGHHLVRVRPFDTQGQGALFIKSRLVYVEPHAEPGVRIFQQGMQGYSGCADATVRKQGGEKNKNGTEGGKDDLECWKFGRDEFSESYLRFDLSGSGIAADAKISRVTLVLQGSRQNQIDVEGKRCKYLVGMLKAPWDQDMTFATRPQSPGWVAKENPDPAPDLSGSWPSLGGMQNVWPPKPVVIDLTPLKDTVRKWISDPEGNFGLVISPAFGKDYNMSFKGVRCPYATLRPKLVIEMEK